MLIYLLTLIDNEGDRQTFTAIYQEYHGPNGEGCPADSIGT